MGRRVKVRFYNTEKRKLEDFIPLQPGKAGIYCCGPTVYNYPHIGNLRAFVFDDILRRSLEFAGYDVTFVMNITDVGHLTDDGDEGEDKMIKASREKGMDVWDIAAFFTEAFEKDCRDLGIKQASVLCKATDHIQDMIDFIKKIDDNGFAYQAGGNVYFDTSRLDDYGRLAGLKLDDLKAGARVEVDPNKRNPADFVLWFTNSKFADQSMVWDSPWGRGYPGWHIECSAMSSKYLGSRIDIHCGGIDHVPVHHTNEIAQSEAAFGEKWVNFWLHNEFLVMKDGKMSKSKGGFITLKSLIEQGFHPLDYRYFLLGAHYRSQQMFSEESLRSAASARKKLIGRIKDLAGETGEMTYHENKEAKAYMERFKKHLFNDLNTPRCLADAWDLLKDDSLKAGEKLSLLLEMDNVLGLDLESSFKTEDIINSAEIEDLISKRNKARKNRNFQEADRIRDILDEMGIVIKDTAEGTTWESKN